MVPTPPLPPPYMKRMQSFPNHWDVCAIISGAYLAPQLLQVSIYGVHVTQTHRGKREHTNWHMHTTQHVCVLTHLSKCLQVSGLYDTRLAAMFLHVDLGMYVCMRVNSFLELSRWNSELLDSFWFIFQTKTVTLTLRKGPSMNVCTQTHVCSLFTWLKKKLVWISRPKRHARLCGVAGAHADVVRAGRRLVRFVEVCTHVRVHMSLYVCFFMYVIFHTDVG